MSIDEGTIMNKGTMNAQMQGPAISNNKDQGWQLQRPGQAKEGFGCGPHVSDIR